MWRTDGGGERHHVGSTSGPVQSDSGIVQLAARSASAMQLTMRRQGVNVTLSVTRTAIANRRDSPERQSAPPIVWSTEDCRRDRPERNVVRFDGGRGKPRAPPSCTEASMTAKAIHRPLAPLALAMIRAMT